MADTLLSFGVEKLWDLLVRESERFQGVEDQFGELKSEVKTLRSFLEDAYAKKHSSARLKNIVKDIKEIVYDAEDIIETFLLKEDLGKTSIRKRIRQLADRRGLAFNMEALSKRIAKVNRDMQSFGVQQLAVNERDTQSLLEIQREIRQTFSSDNEDHLVGLEKNIEQLVGYLVEEASSKIVSIIGMGGIGKTTLARQVFNHEMIKEHFDGVAWVCISQQFTAQYVWQTILLKLSSKHDEQITSNMTEACLQEELFQLLETSNSLIVLDDMWKEEDWDRIKHAFPKKDFTWKVLLTSRNEYVALHADPTCVIFKPDCLTPEESWTLLQRIAFPRKDTACTSSKEDFKVDVEEMENMGKQMVKDCGGLPLAVRVLGGLLAAKHTLSEWKRIYENTGSRIVGGTSINEQNIGHVNHILSLSFEELPIYLKQCFLYLAHFPEDSQISVDDLSYYWAAERIPRPRYYDRATIREVGDGYIEELVRRNMVISERVATTSRFETCQLHDMMREVCLLKAHEENFLQIVDATTTSQSPCKSRRIAVHQLDETSPPKWEMLNPKLRSVLFYYIGKRIYVSFKMVQLMRVLDLSWATFEGGKLPSSIGKLIHLRYLSLRRAKVDHLPSSMKNLTLLLYLNLDFYPERPLYMAPNLFKEMRELTYLSLPWNIHSKVKLELGNQVNLERLFNFSTEHCSVRDLHRMTRLTTLKIRFNGKGGTMNTLSSSLSELRNLENLSIVSPTHDDDDVDDGDDGGDGIEGFVLDCGIHVKQLFVDIYMPKLPEEQHFSSHLTILSLWHCCLVEDPMPILEKLLHLKEVNLMFGAFAGKRMVCSGGGFPQLHTLQLVRLDYLEEWIVEEGSMPLLHTLAIKYCRELKQLPDRLQFIYSLKNLIITEEWKEKLSEGGEEYYKVQHIPLVQFSMI